MGIVPLRGNFRLYHQENAKKLRKKLVNTYDKLRLVTIGNSNLLTWLTNNHDIKIVNVYIQ